MHCFLLYTEREGRGDREGLGDGREGERKGYTEERERQRQRQRETDRDRESLQAACSFLLGLACLSLLRTGKGLSWFTVFIQCQFESADGFLGGSIPQRYRASRSERNGKARGFGAHEQV